MEKKVFVLLAILLVAIVIAGCSPASKTEIVKDKLAQAQAKAEAVKAAVEEQQDEETPAEAGDSIPSDIKAKFADFSKVEYTATYDFTEDLGDGKSKSWVETHVFRDNDHIFVETDIDGKLKDNLFLGDKYINCQNSGAWSCMQMRRSEDQGIKGQFRRFADNADQYESVVKTAPKTIIGESADCYEITTTIGNKFVECFDSYGIPVYMESKTSGGYVYKATSVVNGASDAVFEPPAEPVVLE